MYSFGSLSEHQKRSSPRVSFLSLPPPLLSRVWKYLTLKEIFFGIQLCKLFAFLPDSVENLNLTYANSSVALATFRGAVIIKGAEALFFLTANSGVK